MSKQTSDDMTFDMFSKPRRGRPRKLYPMSDAQRSRNYRQRKKFPNIIVTRHDNSEG